MSISDEQFEQLLGQLDDIQPDDEVARLIAQGASLGFSDEIEAWVIKEFKNIGLDTARSVLEASVEELVKRTDLEEETILDVQRILKEEFEE